jgi:hypothetical protein
MHVPLEYLQRAIDERIEQLRAQIEQWQAKRAELDRIEATVAEIRAAVGDPDPLPGQQPSSDAERGKPPIGAPERVCPECQTVFAVPPGRAGRRIYCGTPCRNRAGTRNRGPRRRQKAANSGDEAAKEPAGVRSASGGHDLSVAGERDPPREGRDQGGGEGEVPAGATRLELDHGVVCGLAADLTIRAAGAEEGRPAFVGGGEQDFAIDDLAGGAQEGDAGSVLTDPRPLQGLVGVDLCAAPVDHGLHGQRCHPGCALDGGLIGIVDEGGEAEIEQAPYQGVEAGVGIGSDHEHGGLLEEAAGQAAVANPAGRPLPNRPVRVPCARAQREAAPKLCRACGQPVDGAVRGHSQFCSDECRAEGARAHMPSRKAGNGGNPWAFALHPALFCRLDHRQRVHLRPNDLARVERHRAKAGR